MYGIRDGDMMRLRLLLPFVMLCLAALACDGGISYDTVFVRAINADSAQPDHIRVLVDSMQGWSGDETMEGDVQTNSIAFVTTDGGQSWAQTEMFDPPDAALALEWQGEGLLHNDAPIWTFPRAGFRQFFYEWTNVDDTIDRFVLRQGSAHNIVVGDALFVSLGTEGVLALPAPGSDSTRAQEMWQNIPGLRPLPLGFRDPLTVIGVILAALVVPPLVFIHAYVLSRVWRYLMPAPDAWRKSLRLSLVFALVAAIGIALWIVPTNFDITFAGLVVGVGGIVVIVGVVATVLHARTAGVRSGTTWRAGIAAAVVSLFVPIGVGGVWLTWWAVILLVVGYAILAWLVEVHLRANDIILQPAKSEMSWAVDSAVLRAMAVLVGIMILFVVGSAFLRFRIPYDFQSLFELFNGIALLIVSTLIIRTLFNRHAQHWRARITPSSDLQPANAVQIGAGIVGWVVFSGGAAYLLLIAQMMVAGWFNTLMTP
jgi:hypothetical protein